MKISGIYQIQSLCKPDRIYIGSAVDIYRRWRKHHHDLRKGNHHSKKLQLHYNKYGEADLQFSILIGCDKAELIKIEQYFLDSHKPYFNVCQTAGSTLGMKLSEEQCKKMSEANKGQPAWNKGIPASEEAKKNMSKAMKGKKAWNKGRKGLYVASEESKRKMSESNARHFKGKHHSEKTRKKMSEAHKGQIPGMKGKHHSEETRLKISKAAKNRPPISEETRRKMSVSSAKAFKGKHHSEETKTKLSAANKGKQMSEETRVKMSEAMKGRTPWNKGIKMLSKEEIIINQN